MRGAVMAYPRDPVGTRRRPWATAQESSGSIR
jgi:hypothetical protein